MSLVAVVTDSSACLPQELLNEHQIVVVPLAFLFDGRLHHDGEFSPAEFYSRLGSCRRLPTTTAPAPGEFLQAFRGALAAGADSILCLTLSAAFSGTYSAAVNAADLLAQEAPGANARVVDTGGIAMTHGFAVLAAARALKAGAGIDEAAEAARRVARAGCLVGALDTMRFLARSGRVPRIAHWAASALSIKPIFAANGETTGGVDRVRTMKRARERLLEHMARRIRRGAPLHAAVMHAEAREGAEELCQLVRSRFRPDELLVTEFTPVMGVHTGPGFLGLAFYQDRPEQGPAPSLPRQASRLERDVRRLAATLAELPAPVARPALIVLCGLPGSGKSHLARELADRLPLACLEADALRRALVRRPTYSQAESTRLFAACHALLDELLARGVPALLDATNLKEAHRRPLYRLAETQNARLVMVQVEATEEVVRDRLTARELAAVPDGSSQAGHDVCDRMRQGADPIQRAHITVNGSGDVSRAVDAILQELHHVPV
jgi:DegV family protein with EDD domain